MDYEKIIVKLIQHFIANEGTDYLNPQREGENFEALSDEENHKLTELRDKARKVMGWQEY